MTKLKTKFGRVYKKYDIINGERIERSTWTVRYKGKDYATGETDPKAAQKFLLKLAGDLADEKKGRKLYRPVKQSVLMNELFDDLLANYERKENNSTRDTALRVKKHLRPAFGEMVAENIGTDEIEKYINSRKKAGAANATINKELAFLRRSFRLAWKRTPKKISTYPAVELLPVNNARTGFMRREDYIALRDAMPVHLRLLFVVDYHTGGRRGELLQLRWRDVYLDENRFFLPPEITKTKDGRWIPIYGDMMEEFNGQWARNPVGCDLVFHENGGAMKTFYKAWKSALSRAGMELDLKFHDLRRTAIRNMVRAGIPRKVAMQISGHKTESVFERYNIVDEADLTEAAGKLEKFHAQ